jgi:protein tyrosine phosphatase
METNLWREVTHLWYFGWPATGVPDEANSVIAFIIEARAFMKANSGPSVVHCSPGTGRTGTVIAADLCIRDFEKSRVVDIPKVVHRLRRDRAGAVQTKEQYLFIYQVSGNYSKIIKFGKNS